MLAEQLQIPVEIVEYEGTSTDFYASDAAKSYLDAYPYNWDALVRAGDDPSCEPLGRSLEAKEVVATARVVNKVKPLEVSVRIKD